MRVVFALIAVASASAVHNNKFHHLHHRALRGLHNHHRSALEANAEITTEPTRTVNKADVPGTTIAGAISAPAAFTSNVTEDKDPKTRPTAGAKTAAPDLRAQMTVMGARIRQLEKQLELAHAHPPPMPPPFTRFLHHFGQVSPHGLSHGHDKQGVRFQGWHRWHSPRDGHRHHHPLLCFTILAATLYGIIRCMKCCCRRHGSGITEYPAALPVTRGGVVHNPYVGVGASSAAVVPTAEPQAVPLSVVPSAPAPVVEGFASAHSLQHGVVLGTPAMGTPVGLVS